MPVVLPCELVVLGSGQLYRRPSVSAQLADRLNLLHTGAAEPRGPGGQLTPTFLYPPRPLAAHVQKLLHRHVVLTAISTSEPGSAGCMAHS